MTTGIRPHRICIVQLTGIGDVVHALPIANDLKRAYPGCAVVWVAEPAPARVLDHHPAVDEVVVFDKARGAAGVIDLAAQLRGRSCDLALNMQRHLKGVFPTLLSGARARIGLPRSKTREGVHLFHTAHLSEGPWRHTQDQLLAFRAPLGIRADAPIEWRITFSREEREAQRRWTARMEGSPVAGLVLATANPKKDWPAERYGPLARALAELGYRVALLGGPSPRERAAAARVLADLPGAIDATGDSVREMMWRVDAVDLLVSPDTGPLHVAHARGTPVVGLYGHTNPARVGPWLRYRDLVVDRYTAPGRDPDPSAYEPKLGRMEEIRVEDVLERVMRARATYGTRKPR